MGRRLKLKFQPSITAVVEAGLNLAKIESHARKNTLFQQDYLFPDAILMGLGQVEGDAFDPDIVRKAIVTAYVMGSMNK
jgi:hypothetical protein